MVNPLATLFQYHAAAPRSSFQEVDEEVHTKRMKIKRYGDKVPTFFSGSLSKLNGSWLEEVDEEVHT